MKRIMVPVCIFIVAALAYIGFLSKNPLAITHPSIIAEAVPSRESRDSTRDFQDKENLTKLSRNTKLEFLTPEKAKELLEICKNEETNVTAQITQSCAILRQLCENGFSAEAWTLIDDGPGTLRNNEISTFFQATKFESAESIQNYLSKLISPRERNYSIYGLLQGNATTALAMDSTIIPGRSKEEKMGYVFGISDLLKDTETPSATATLATERTIQLAASSNLDPIDLLRIFDSSIVGDSFANWETVEKYSQSFDQISLEKVHSGLASRMIARDPVQAMDLICENPATKYSYPVLSTAVKEFYRVSEDGANSWITNHLDSVDPATAQRLISVVAQEANRNREFETSRKWANRILNAEVRQQLLDQVTEREAKAAVSTSK